MTKGSEENMTSGKRGLWDHLYMKTCFAPELRVLCNKTQGYIKHFALALSKMSFMFC